jgi:hypothetical protein
MLGVLFLCSNDEKMQLVKLAGVWVCWVQYFTQFYGILKYYTEFYSNLHNFTAFYSIIENFTVFYETLLPKTLTYTNLYVLCLEETKYRSNSGKPGFFFVVS